MKNSFIKQNPVYQNSQACLVSCVLLNVVVDDEDLLVYLFKILITYDYLNTRSNG